MVSESELVSEAKRLESVGVTVTKRNWQEHSDFNYHAVRRVFGGLNELKREAGLGVDNRGGNNRVCDEQLLEDLKRVADGLGQSPTMEAYNEHGEFNSSTFEDRFDGWNDALEAGDLDIVKGYNVDREGYECPNCGNVNLRLPSNVKNQDNVFCNKPCNGEYYGQRLASNLPNNNSGENHPQWVSNDKLQNDYLQVAELLGKTPSQLEYNEFGEHSYRVIRDRWGSMRALQEECGLEPLKKGRVEFKCKYCGKRDTDIHARKDSRSYCDPDCMAMDYEERLIGEGNPNWAGGGPWYYGPNWPIQRRKALVRDGYACQVCGMGEEENGRGLSVHHIHRDAIMEKDYKRANRLHNLITVCDSCHGRVEAGNVPVQAKL